MEKEQAIGKKKGLEKDLEPPGVGRKSGLKHKKRFFKDADPGQIT
jgi:hypothetical protein